MMPVVVQVRRLRHHDGLPLPSRQTDGAAGYDVASAEPDFTLEPHARRLVRTGLALAIPPGYEAQVRPRSGLALKYGLTLPNTPATIDSDYRGELMIPMINLGTEPVRSEEHTSELQSLAYLVCRLLLGKKKSPSRYRRRSQSSW